MAKELSVAPKERINIKYVPATGDQKEEVELPLKMVVLGDFSGRADETRLEDRQAVSIDKENFDKVLKEMNLERDIEVPDTLSGEDGPMLSMKLVFEKLKDFEPDQLVMQVPELRKLVELREALIALKSPLGNKRNFRTELERLLKDDDSRAKIREELGLKDDM